MTCVELESRLYTRESEGKKKGGGERGEGIERGSAHVRCASFIWAGLSTSCAAMNRGGKRVLIVLQDLMTP